MIIQAVYCDNCERLVKLTKDDHCIICGQHIDNMNHPEIVPLSEEEELKENYEDFLDELEERELGGEG